MKKQKKILKYSDLKKEELLVCVRKNKDFRKTAKRFVTEYTNLNDHYTLSEYEIADHYIDLNKYDINDLSEEDWKILDESVDIQDVVLRDRLLRNIELINAKELIYKVSKWFIEFFKEYKIKVLILHIVDNYTMDLMVRIANIYNINVIGICPIFFSGYKRITIYGEHNKIRDVDSSEIEQVKNELENNFKSYMTPSLAKAFKGSFYYYFKYKIKYIYLYVFLHKFLQKKNYDYYSIPYGARVKSVSYFFPFKHYTSKLPEKSENNVYIPMHYHPEATIEYWSDNLKDVDYISSLIEVVRRFSDQGYNVYLKEHPGMCFWQNPSLYKKIKKIENVSIIHPFLNTCKVLDNFDNVVVWTGSTGVEALLRNKKVFFMCSNYYFDKTSDDLYEANKLTSEKQKEDLIERILSNTIPWN
ncbi:MAG: hypothetical protein GQ570_11145 [Helicobacteraceae bacterium]|nr:hypothetical protein [Helicobacteraceae bacterium]